MKIKLGTLVWKIIMYGNDVAIHFIMIIIIIFSRLFLCNLIIHFNTE